MKAHSPERRALGRAAEARALAFLQSQGLRLVAQNWHCRSGELDLVLLDGETLVFAEVRYRKNNRFGGALESVDAGKQRRLARSAQSFLQQQRDLGSQACRFDVLALSQGMQPEWIKNAFELPADCA